MNTITGLYNTATGLSQLRQGFAKADTDGSKALSFAEFEAAAKANPNITASAGVEATFAKLDADGNKQITANEITQGLNLTSQVYSALLQGQEIRSGNAFLTLLGSTSGSSSLFGSSGTDFSSLTSNLMGGGSASTYLTSLASGANANTTLLAAMFDGSGGTASRLESLLSQYIATDTLA